MATLAPAYAPRRPTETALYGVVRDNLETFLSWARETYAKPLPRYVEQEFRASHLGLGFADVRMVQVMLGHASLDTTALYTHVAIRALKEVHERTHPGARLGKPAKTSKIGAAEVEAAELLAALEAEQAEETERSGAGSAFDEEPATE